MSTLSKIKQLLLRQQKTVEADIKSLEKDDPVMNGNSMESSEPGTDSWLADVHSRVVAVKINLQLMLSNTKKALDKMRLGKYGKCENCGKMIEPDRLKAMPIAILCISCSKRNMKPGGMSKK